jgi:hypothetical protein
MSEFPVKEFVEAVVRIASADPDKVYDQPLVFDTRREEWVDGHACRYVEQDPDTEEYTGSCLIGCALLESGAATAELFLDDNDFNVESFSGLVDNAGWNIPENVVKWANEIQGHQDSKTPWGAALRGAEEHLGRPVV